MTVPELAINPSACLPNRPFSIRKGAIGICNQERKNILARHKDYRKIVADLKLMHPKITVYDPLDIFCDDSTCYAIREDNLYYFDDDHISVSGSKSILNTMIKHRVINAVEN